MNWWASKSQMKKHYNPLPWPRFWEEINYSSGRSYIVGTLYYQDEFCWHWYNGRDGEHQINHFEQPSLTEQLIKAAEFEKEGE